ncbi:hypothetical protein AAVH_11258 [Aphelenchoides avenae]|nr:hypothetical protein AAVH_11258 [Aphelenchus avenae]
MKKKELCQVLVYLDDGACDRRLEPQTQSDTARKSQSKLLLPDFASEVYGFLERVHLGTSLTANRRLSALLSKLKNRLPVHHLLCQFEERAR